MLAGARDGPYFLLKREPGTGLIGAKLLTFRV